MKSPLLRSLSKLLRESTQTPASPREAGLSRRQFLSGAGLAAGALLADQALGAIPRWLRSSEKVLIVGAGVAGLTVAYRLTQAGIPCEIFDAATRVGGRMQTLNGFNADKMFVELGGEFIDSSHEALLKLCAELKVEVDDFIAGDAGLEHELYFAGGRIRSQEDLSRCFAPLAEGLAADIGVLSKDGELVTPTYLEPGGAEGLRLDKLSLKAYLEAQRNRVDGWVLDLVERAFVGEYGGEASDQSALNLLVLVEPSTKDGVKFYGASDEAKRVRGGNQRLPEALARALQGRVPMHLGAPLIDIREKNLNLRLTFACFGGGYRSVESRRVLLALPFSTLREVGGIRSLALSAAKRRSVFELGYGTNAKLMLGFRDRFWRRASAHAPASTGQMFWDVSSHEIWETSRLQNGARGILTSFIGGRAGLNPDVHLVKNTLRALESVHGQGVRSFDSSRAYKSWGRLPYSRGSYTCPKPGQYTSFIGCEGETELNGRLFFAGEHCSLDYQGYMNGAVESAEAAVARMVGKPQPIMKFGT